MVPVPDADPKSRRVVVLRKDLGDHSLAPEAAHAAVAALARGLEPGELLAVHARADLTSTGPWQVLLGDDLRTLVCSFAPDDHELFVWRSPPELPESVGAVVDGELTLDVRPVEPPLAVLASVAAVARLLPGEALVHVGDRPPLLLADLLRGRATMSGPRWTDEAVSSRIVRLPGPAAAELPAHPSRSDRLSAV